MKNRKAPVFLFGVLVIGVGVMAVFNANQKSSDPEQQQQTKEETVDERALTPEQRKNASQGILSALDKKSGDEAEGRKPVAAGGEEASTDMASEPTVLIKSYTASRPLPNDSSTATHWYDEESRSYKISGENAKSRG